MDIDCSHLLFRIHFDVQMKLFLTSALLDLAYLGSLSVSFFLAPKYTHSHILSPSHTFFLFPSLLLIGSDTFCFTHRHTYSLSLTLSLSLSHVSTFSHSHPFSLFVSCTYMRAHTHTHSSSIPLCYGRCPFPCSLACSFFNIFFSCHHKRTLTLSLSLSHTSIFSLYNYLSEPNAHFLFYFFSFWFLSLLLLFSLSLSLSLYPTQTFSMYFSISLFP